MIPFTNNKWGSIYHGHHGRFGARLGSYWQRR